MESSKTKKTISIVLNTLLYLFMGICVVSLLLVTISKKKGDDAINVFGYQMRRVISPSMEACEYTDVSDFDIKSLRVDTMIFIEVLPEDEAERNAWYASLKEGDVLTFKYTYVRQEVITHRITEIKENGYGGYYITLQGDNISSSEGAMSQEINTSDETSFNYVLGKVVGQSFILGKTIAVLSSTAGMVFLIIVPILIVFGLEVVKLVRLLTQDKREKKIEEDKAKDEELELLRRKIEELEREKN